MTPNHEPKKPPVTIGELAGLARREKWDKVDLVLGAVCDDTAFLEWARDGLGSKNPHERDLAASLFERSSEPLDEDAKDRLNEAMVSDENTYARYRSAFALSRHGERSDAITATLQQALADDDVAEISQGYLDQLAGKGVDIR